MARKTVVVIPLTACLLVTLFITLRLFRDAAPGATPFTSPEEYSGVASETSVTTTVWTATSEEAWQPGTPRNAWDSNNYSLMKRPKPFPAPWTHHELAALSTTDGSYIMLDFGTDVGAINPNMIPHPKMKDTWFLIAQHGKEHGYPDFSPNESFYFDELSCLAKFEGDILRCVSHPYTLPIANTPNSPHCEGELTYVILSTAVGPHDARIAYGPEYPVAIYGEKSQHACLGLWVQDLRVLVDWDYEDAFDRMRALNTAPFRQAVEIQRPDPVGIVEKNYFLFWDDAGATYAHYDMAPKRAFAKLNDDGSAGPDLGPEAAPVDEECMQKYMPSTGDALEDIHQATNSLSITLCERADPNCVPDNSNTFIMAIWQWKSYHGFHGAYEPYLALFKRTAPFELFGLTDRPYWLRGRGGFGEGRLPNSQPDDHTKAEWNQTEMLYITSFSWKTQGLKYHGYLDDILWIGFGVEDNYTAAVDLKANDLFKDLQPCLESDNSGLRQIQR